MTFSKKNFIILSILFSSSYCSDLQNPYLGRGNFQARASMLPPGFFAPTGQYFNVGRPVTLPPIMSLFADTITGKCFIGVFQPEAFANYEGLANFGNGASYHHIYTDPLFDGERIFPQYGSIASRHFFTIIEPVKVSQSFLAVFPDFSTGLFYIGRFQPGAVAIPGLYLPVRQMNVPENPDSSADGLSNGNASRGKEDLKKEVVDMPPVEIISVPFTVETADPVLYPTKQEPSLEVAKVKKIVETVRQPEPRVARKESKKKIESSYAARVVASWFTSALPAAPKKEEKVIVARRHHSSEPFTAGQWEKIVTTDGLFAMYIPNLNQDTSVLAAISEKQEDDDAAQLAKKKKEEDEVARAARAKKKEQNRSEEAVIREQKAREKEEQERKAAKINTLEVKLLDLHHHLEPRLFIQLYQASAELTASKPFSDSIRAAYLFSLFVTDTLFKDKEKKLLKKDVKVRNLFDVLRKHKETKQVDLQTLKDQDLYAAFSYYLMHINERKQLAEIADLVRLTNTIKIPVSTLPYYMQELVVQDRYLSPEMDALLIRDSKLFSMDVLPVVRTIYRTSRDMVNILRGISAPISFFDRGNNLLNLAGLKAWSNMACCSNNLVLTGQNSLMSILMLPEQETKSLREHLDDTLNLYLFAQYLGAVLQRMPSEVVHKECCSACYLSLIPFLSTLDLLKKVCVKFDINHEAVKSAQLDVTKQIAKTFKLSECFIKAGNKGLHDHSSESVLNDYLTVMRVLVNVSLTTQMTTYDSLLDDNTKQLNSFVDTFYKKSLITLSVKKRLLSSLETDVSVPLLEKTKRMQLEAYRLALKK